MADARSYDDLRRFWDEIARGEPAAPGDLDPDLAATIRRLHELDDAPPPDPAYARRLRETIMQASTVPLPTPFPAQPNGRREPDIPGGALSPRLGLRREPRRLWPLLATAALIALTLAAGFVAIGGIGRNATRPDKPQGIPVLAGTPAPTLPPGVTGAQTIFQQRLDAIPVDASCPLVERETLQPGGTWTMGSIPPAYRGPTVYRVESGSIAVTANGVVQLTRAGGAAATEVRAGTPTTLAVGDRYFTATDVVTQWRNPGAAPAVVLYAGVITPSMGENGVGATEDNIVDICPIKLPPTLLGANAALLTVRRFTLAPGAAMANPPGAGLSFLTVERGTLTVVWANVDAPATPTGTRVFAGGGSIQINGASIGYASYFARTLQNTGADPLTLIVLTVAPVETAATPAP